MWSINAPFSPVMPESISAERTGGRSGNKFCAIGEGDVEGVVSDEEEPVSSPGNIAGEAAVARDLDGDGGAKTIAWNI